MAWPAVAAAIASAVAPLAGSYLDYEGQRKANSVNYDVGMGNIALQKEFAKNGIQWKVQDAIKAGIHPLAALGANTTSFSPISVGARGPNASEGFNIAGQNISRAILASATEEAKELREIQLATAREGLKKMQLENVGLLNEIEKSKSPSMPITSQGIIVGQGDSTEPGVIRKPVELPAGQSPGYIVGTGDLYQHVRLPGDKIMAVPHQDYSDSMESDASVQMQSMSQKALRYLQGYKANIFPDSYESQLYIESLEAERPKHHYPLTHEYRYDPVEGVWVGTRKNGKNDHQVFVQGSLNKLFNGGKGYDKGRPANNGARSADEWVSP